MSRPSPFMFSLVCALVAFSFVLSACQDEPEPGEAGGAYNIFRQALLNKDADTVYESLDSETKGKFDEKVNKMQAMSEQITRFLPHVDQKLARQHTGVVLLKKHKINTGKDLFVFLFKPSFEVSDGLRVGTEISEIKYNEDNTQAIILTYGGQTYRLTQEESVWKIASWGELIDTRTQWLSSNEDALEKTVQDLINEEKAEIDNIVKFLIDEDNKRRAAKSP